MFDYIRGYKLLAWLHGCWDAVFAAAAPCASGEVTGHEGMEVKERTDSKKKDRKSCCCLCLHFNAKAPCLLKKHFLPL